MSSADCTHLYVCHAAQACAALVGRPLDEATLAASLEAAQRDAAIADTAPGGKVRLK